MNQQRLHQKHGTAVFAQPHKHFLRPRFKFSYETIPHH